MFQFNSFCKNCDPKLEPIFKIDNQRLQETNFLTIKELPITNIYTYRQGWLRDVLTAKQSGFMNLVLS